MRLSHIVPFVLLLALLQTGLTGKIALFVSEESAAETRFFVDLAGLFATGGHEVVLVRPSFNPITEKIVSRHSGVREIRSSNAQDADLHGNYTESRQELIFGESGPSTWIHYASSLLTLREHVCHANLHDNVFLSRLRAETFDLAVVSLHNACQLGIAYHLGIPRIVPATSDLPTFRTLRRLGTDPHFLLSHAHPLRQRFRDVLATVAFEIVDWLAESKQSSVLQSAFGENFPALSELRSRTIDAVLVNSYQSYFDARGGLTFIGYDFFGTEKKPASKELKSFIDASTSLVVVSFTEVSAELERTLISFFDLRPEVSFIYVGNKTTKVPQNVELIDRSETDAVLKSYKTIALISDHSTSSLNTALRYRIPVIVVPLERDASEVSVMIEALGVGHAPTSVSAVGLNEALQKVQKDTVRIRSRLESFTMSSSVSADNGKNALQWLTFILKAAPETLTRRRPSAFFTIYHADLLALLLAFLGGYLYIVYRIVRCYYWSCCLMAFKEKEKID